MQLLTRFSDTAADGDTISKNGSGRSVQDPHFTVPSAPVRAIDPSKPGLSCLVESVQARRSPRLNRRLEDLANTSDQR